MYHTAPQNIGLGSFNDDFNHLMKDLFMTDLLMKDHFKKGFFFCEIAMQFNILMRKFTNTN